MQASRRHPNAERALCACAYIKQGEGSEARWQQQMAQVRASRPMVYRQHQCQGRQDNGKRKRTETDRRSQTRGIRGWRRYQQTRLHKISCRRARSHSARILLYAPVEAHCTATPLVCLQQALARILYKVKSIVEVGKVAIIRVWHNVGTLMHRQIVGKHTYLFAGLGVWSL